VSFIVCPLEAIASRGQPAHHAAMTKRETRKSGTFVKPDYWSDTPPPKPEPAKDDETLSPTRYGDWVKDGIAVDF
jgi:hypothetical protein